MKIRKLPIGARVRDRETACSFYVAAQEHPGYRGTTLLSELVVRVGCFDAAESTNPASRGLHDRRTYGDNRLCFSNVLQWLNGEGVDWYTPAHVYDAPPSAENTRHGGGCYAEAMGYLSELPGEIKRALLVSPVPVLTQTPDGVPTVKAIEARIFLPSRTELGLGGDWGVDEGVMLPLFHDFRVWAAPMSDRAYKTYTSPWHSMFFRPHGICRWWLRTPHLRYEYLVRYVTEFGGLSFAPAFSDIVGIRPMMNVSGDLEVSEAGETGNIYYIKKEGAQ